MVMLHLSDPIAVLCKTSVQEHLMMERNPKMYLIKLYSDKIISVYKICNFHMAELSLTYLIYLMLIYIYLKRF